MVSVFDLLKDYLESGRIKVDKTKIHHPTTVHDPCNYVRKSQIFFKEHYADMSRWIVKQCIDENLYREMCDDPLNNFCCGAGGGAWAMPYDKERLAYGKIKADQIRDTGAELVIAPCHNCRDQILKGLGKEHREGRMDMGNYKETMYIWELVANILVYEPWSAEEQAAAQELRDAQFERDGVELEEEEEE